MKLLKVKLEYWLPGKTIEASGAGQPVDDSNKSEWSSIRSVIIRVINKIRRPRSGSPIRLIMSMITDRIGRHKVLLPINHNFNEICDI